MSEFDITFHKPPKTKASITFNVKISKWFYFRVWLAKQCFRLGCWFLNSNISFEMEEDNGQSIHK